MRRLNRNIAHGGKYMYDRENRSELELRFEDLFRRIYGCPVKDKLKPQYPVVATVNDEKYYIDYAYISGPKKIAIELDGYSKIKDAADSKKKFKELLARQNAIMAEGFLFYRFTWDDVVNDNGKKVKEMLDGIFGQVDSFPVVKPLVPEPTEEFKSDLKSRWYVLFLFLLAGLFFLYWTPPNKYRKEPPPVPKLEEPQPQPKKEESWKPDAGDWPKVDEDVSSLQKQESGQFSKTGPFVAPAATNTVAGNIAAGLLPDTGIAAAPE